MSIQGFAPTSYDHRPEILKKYFPCVGCDMPEQGGISGNYKMNKKPSPYIKDERPATLDIMTGEMVYKDTQKPKGVYLLA